MKATTNSTLRNPHCIEPLEARIAPAVVIPGAGHTAKYTDVDGDLVTITATGYPAGFGVFTPAMFTTVVSGSGDQLQLLDLSTNANFAGANIVFSVAQVAGGNGLANVGYINSTGYNLKTVSVKGDLGRIDAGVGTAVDPAISALTVNSLGRLGTDTQAGGGNLFSNIMGKLGSLTVKQDVIDASIATIGIPYAKIGSISIGGSLIGGVGGNSGSIVSQGDIGPVTIGHDVQGGSGSSSGIIQSYKLIASVTIRGSLIGGSGGLSGVIDSLVGIGPVTISNDVQGGTGNNSGFISSSGTLGAVKIFGSLLGGSGGFSGAITSNGDMGAVTIYRNMQGGSQYFAGYIGSNGNLLSVKILGSLIGGSHNYTGTILSNGDMGAVTIGHDVQNGNGGYLNTGAIQSLGKLAIVGGVHIGGSLSGEISSIGDMGAVTIGLDVNGGSDSGLISSSGKLGAVKILGSLIGGSNNNTGKISSIGDMGAVTISHNVLGGSGPDSGFIQSGGKLGVVKVLGSLIGGSDTNSGAIFSTGDMAAVTVGHDVKGGSGFGSGRIESEGKLAIVGGVNIGGSLIGGADVGMATSLISSGSILSKGDMGVVTIGHDLLGGTGYGGHVRSSAKLAGVHIGGSLIGGLSFVSGVSGEIFSIGDMGAVTIGHDFTGGSITGSDSLDRSGFIESAAGRIASVTIGGSIISGVDSSSGALTRSATIRAANDIGALTVKGSLIGHGDTGTGASPVVISARGKLVQTTTDLAIGSITVGTLAQGGRVEFANILAGYDINLTPVNADAQIGPVVVHGDWAASNLVAGVKNAASGNTKFGNGNDASIGGGSAIIARIASIKIVGQVFGTPNSASASDHFGFVAEEIGWQAPKLNIGTFPITLNALAHNDNFAVGGTGDMFVHEV